MIRAVMSVRRLALPVFLALTVAGSALGLTACGSETVDVPGASANVQRGATLFNERCSGCHSMSVAGAQGSATKVSDRERVDGPNFDVRKVCYENSLYALQNGGYSGAIMPANIVVGQDARDVSAFLAEWSGKDADEVASPTGPAVSCPPVPAGAGG
jgi:mono/diheme cytochrome c family protein